MFTYKELLKKGENELLASDISDAAIDAWYLFEYVTDMSRASFFIRRNEEIPEEQANAYIEVIEKRKKRIRNVLSRMSYHMRMTKKFLICVPVQDVL